MKNKKNGFTLVELLAVIAVLGLVLIIAVPKITNTMENSKKKTLMLTAKSIARYDRIAKDKDFAEYYLLGTLLSTIAVVLSSFIVRLC